MRSSFFGINIGTQGLYAARAGLDVTTHNITNSENSKYSRQIADIRASRPIGLRNGKGMMGTGAELYGIDRMRDFYTDVKLWNSNSNLGTNETKLNLMKDIEASFNELSDSGFNKVFNGIFDSLQDLSKNAGDSSYKIAVVENANSFVKYFNTTAGRLSEIQNDMNQNIEIKVNEINDIASQITNLNGQIEKLEFTGDKANDLRDQRAALVDKLSKIVNVEAKEVKKANGYSQFNIKINGDSFINHTSARKLEAVSRKTKLNPEDIDDLYDVKWADGNVFDLHNSELKGELKAYAELRDGSNGKLGEKYSEKGIPYYIGKLNDFVRTFAMEFNKVHKNGEKADGSKAGNFFASKDYTGTPPLDESDVSSYEQITAKNFSLDAALLEDVDNFATTYNTVTGESDNTLVFDLLQVKQNRKVFNKSDAGNYMEMYLAEVGIETKKTKNFYSNELNINKTIENQRLSISGVDLNEETNNMLKFQQAYNMAAKMISVMDQIYDVTINRMGV